MLRFALVNFVLEGIDVPAKYFLNSFLPLL